MTFRRVRLTDFNTERLPGAVWDVELLCRDSRGVYVLPFPGRRMNGAWVNGRTNDTLEVEVVGWRLWEDRFSSEPRHVGARRLADSGGERVKPDTEQADADSRKTRFALD
jgi:hypothetical protein